MINFSKFAESLFPIISEGVNTANFTRELFTNITRYTDGDESEKNPVSEAQIPTLKAYYNGTRQISLLARKINKYLDIYKFAEYIDTANEDAKANICDVLISYCPDIDQSNVSIKCAELFQSIILNSATGKPNNSLSGCKSHLDSNQHQELINKISNAVSKSVNCQSKKASSIFKKHTPAKEFVNREKPREIFRNAIDACPSLYKNVIMYNGIGGIGKSSLIKNLKEYLIANNVPYSSIDFDDPSLRSCFNSLISLEKNLNRVFQHFDIAASIYFYKKNPNFSYKDNGLPNEIAQLISKDFIQDGNYFDVVNNFYKDYALSLNLNSEIKEELQQLEFLSPNEIEKKLTQFFAYDLINYLESENIEKYVMFFDTYELLWPNGKNETNKLSTDSWLRALVSDLNNILFVISGREELLWSLDSQFPSDKIKSIQLEMLSYDYAKRFLESCQITDCDIQERIITSSNGYPYYLDLCVDTYYKLSNNGSVITIDSFGSGFQEIQELFFRSLTTPEVETLKVLSIPRFYDFEIFKYLINEFNTGYPISNIHNFNAFSFIKVETDSKNIIHALMRNEISIQLPGVYKKDIHNSMIAFYNMKLESSKLEIDQIRFYFSELLFHLKSSKSSLECTSYIEEKYIPLIKRFQVSGETKYILDNFEDLFIKSKDSIGGTSFFSIMIDMIHLSGRYMDAVSIIDYYLNEFNIKDIATNSYRLNLFIRKIHHEMFYMSTEKLEADIQKILENIDQDSFTEQYCETLFMLGAHICLPAADYKQSGKCLKAMMNFASKNKFYGLLCRGLRKYSELLCAQKKFDAAEKICLTGLRISKFHKLSRYEFYLHCVLGEIKRLTGDTNSALEIFNKQMPVAKSLGITGWIAHVHMSLGNCYADQNKFDLAFDSYNSAKEIYSSINQIWGLLNVDIALCRAHLLTGDKLEPGALINLKLGAEKYGYNVLVQNINFLNCGDLRKIQFEYL